MGERSSLTPTLFAERWDNRPLGCKNLNAPRCAIQFFRMIQVMQDPLPEMDMTKTSR